MLKVYVIVSVVVVKVVVVVVVVDVSQLCRRSDNPNFCGQ